MSSRDIICDKPKRHGEATTKSENDNLFLNKEFNRRCEVNVKTPEDSKASVITGCVFMPTGEVVLCDRLNETIKRLNKSFEMVDRLDVQAEPYGVSVVDSNNVLITLTSLKQLQFIQVIPRLWHGPVIELDKPCWGVEAKGEEIYVTCNDALSFSESRSGEVRVLTFGGELLRRLGINRDGSFMFHRPYCLTVSELSGKVYVSDAYTSKVTCMTPDGGVVYQYGNTDPKGDLSWSLGLIVDAGENVIVCGNDGNTADIFTAKGKRHKTFHVLANGPNDVAYRQADNIVIFGCSDGKLHIFKSRPI